MTDVTTVKVRFPNCSTGDVRVRKDTTLLEIKRIVAEVLIAQKGEPFVPDIDLDDYRLVWRLDVEERK